MRRDEMIEFEWCPSSMMISCGAADVTLDRLVERTSSGRCESFVIGEMAKESSRDKDLEHPTDLSEASCEVGAREPG